MPWRPLPHLSWNIYCMIPFPIDLVCGALVRFGCCHWMNVKVFVLYLCYHAHRQRLTWERGTARGIVLDTKFYSYDDAIHDDCYCNMWHPNVMIINFRLIDLGCIITKFNIIAMLTLNQDWRKVLYWRTGISYNNDNIYKLIIL